MLYQIPLFERFVGSSLSGRARCLAVDNVGLFVYHDGDRRKLSKKYLRNCLHGRASTECVVEAPNIRKAIKIFYNEWWGANVGGESEESKALWINRQEPIVEMPFCALLHKNKKGRFICGEESKESESHCGEFGVCVLEGYDAPDECPISIFSDIQFLQEKAKNLPIKTLVADGKEFKVVSAKDIMPLQKRVWLKVDGLQLRFYERDAKNLQKKIVWMSIKVGSSGFNASGYFQNHASGLSQNWQGSISFLDQPNDHYGRRRPEWLLDDLLAKTLYDAYLQGKKAELTAFLEGIGQAPETPFFKPEEWGKKSLRIPVDFVKLSHFECRSEKGPVMANVQLGAHLIFWRVKVYDGNGTFVCEDKLIHDKRILNAVDTLLYREEIRTYLKEISRSGRWPMDDKEFVDEVPGCDKEKIPAVRFY